MKKLLTILIVAFGLLGVLGSIFLLLRNPGAVSTSAAQPWPAEMGPLKSAAERYPPHKGNEASVKLASLANALPKSDAVDDFLARELTRAELTIGEPPAIPDVSAIRELVLRESIVWEREEGVGGGNEMNARRTVQMSVARLLVAIALAKARANDKSAWDDLQAVWKLARTLDEQPQMMAQTAALTMVRMINAVAWKMPLPAPEWFAELQARDHLQLLLESFQYQASTYWKDASWIFPTKWLAKSIEHDRQIAVEVSKLTQCDVNIRMNELGTDLSSVWRRAFRYRAEREATANALRLREGKSIETSSRCTDGAWTFDGTTLRFSREIPTASPDTPMPLTVRVK